MAHEFGEKTCLTCGQSKPREAFYEKKDSKDGLLSYCKTCWLVYCERRRRALGMKSRDALPRKGRFYDVPEGRKYCPRCKTVKPLEDFHFTTQGLTERFAWCKPCALTYQETRRRAKGIKPRVDTSGTKLCPRCGEVKPLDQYPKDPRRARGINSYCFPCYRAYARHMAKKHGYNKQRAARKVSGLGPSKHEAAAQIVKYAVKLGVLTRGSCVVCGTTERIQAHHTDYTKPLDVTWLCRLHHNHAHGQLLDQTQ